MPERNSPRHRVENTENTVTICVLTVRYIEAMLSILTMTNVDFIVGKWKEIKSHLTGRSGKKGLAG